MSAERHLHNGHRHTPCLLSRFTNIRPGNKQTLDQIGNLREVGSYLFDIDVKSVIMGNRQSGVIRLSRIQRCHAAHSTRSFCTVRTTLV